MGNALGEFVRCHQRRRAEAWNELVLIGCHVFAEDTQILLAVAVRNVAEHLIVRAILFDDVNHVLDEARLSDALRHGPGRRIRPRRRRQ